MDASADNAMDDQPAPSDELLSSPITANENNSEKEFITSTSDAVMPITSDEAMTPADATVSQDGGASVEVKDSDADQSKGEEIENGFSSASSSAAAANETEPTPSSEQIETLPQEPVKEAKKQSIPPISTVSLKAAKKVVEQSKNNEEIKQLLVSLHIPESDTLLYIDDFIEQGFESVKLLRNIEMDDFKFIKSIKKLAHKKAIAKWASTTVYQAPKQTVMSTAATNQNSSTLPIIPEPLYNHNSIAGNADGNDETASVSTATNSTTNPSATNTVAAAQPEEKRKVVFSVKASPQCAFCTKTVYKTEETMNSKNVVFHKECLRCFHCKASLAGKEPVTSQTGPVRTAQYRVEEGTGNLLCDKHAVSRVNVVQGATKDTKTRRQSEIDKIEKETHERNLQVRDSMQYSIGDLTPVCSRCGYALEKDQQIIVSGMERFHAVCPTAEEAAKMIRSCRFFAKKLPERLATTFTCDKVTKTPHTFLYEIDKDSVTQAMMLQKHETCTIVYKPDTAARAALKRKLMVPQPNNREFDLATRDMDGLTFEDVKGRKGDKAGPLIKPQYNKDAKSLEIVKTKIMNGVLHTFAAKFNYDEPGESIEPISIAIKLEMWPPIEEKANDPLAQLRSRMKMRETRGDSLMFDGDVPPAEKEDKITELVKPSLPSPSTATVAAPTVDRKKSEAVGSSEPAPLNAEAPTGRKTGVLGKLFGGKKKT